jgi:hypothetical protein
MKLKRGNIEVDLEVLREHAEDPGAHRGEGVTEADLTAEEDIHQDPEAKVEEEEIDILRGHTVVHIQDRGVFHVVNIRVDVDLLVTDGEIRTNQEVETVGDHHPVRDQEIKENIQAALRHHQQLHHQAPQVAVRVQVHLKKEVTRKNQFLKKSQKRQFEKKEQHRVQKQFHQLLKFCNRQPLLSDIMDAREITTVRVPFRPIAMTMMIAIGKLARMKGKNYF